MEICYIVGAGECNFFPKPENDSLIIAADGGYDTLLNFGIKPSFIVGDLDSVKNVPENIEIVRYRVKKDETDMHLAYLEAKRRGYKNFRIFGGIGGRLDHTLANVSLLSYIKNMGDDVELVGDREDIFIVKNECISLLGISGNYFSVFAYGADAEGVSIKNAEYEIENFTLTTSFPLGVSNRFKNRCAEIKVDNGTLIIIVQK